MEKQSPPKDFWECSDDQQSLRVIGRTRVPDSTEGNYSAIVEIACRGTRNTENWVTNLTAQLKACELGTKRGRVHAGFQDAYLLLQKAVMGNISPIFEDVNKAAPSGLIAKPVLVYVSGFSLGGALATLAAYDIATSKRCTVQCITWGSPRVGDAEFVREYQSAISSTVRFVNRADIVPRLPANPDDPNDDGPVLGFRLGDWFERLHQKAGVNEYMHVCKGHQLGREQGGLQQALGAINTALDQGMSSGLSQALQVHHFTTYADNTDAVLDGAADRSEIPASPDAAETAGRVLKGVATGLGWAYNAYANRRRSDA